MSQTTKTVSEEDAVYQRYANAAQAVEPALCCPVEYPREMLQAIPSEVIERDYGCGDPTPYVRPGDTVLDLGSGGGKLCFIASQLVGERGKVIGVDCNQEMMALARSAAPQVAKNVGYANVEFRYGMIQDLRLNMALLEEQLRQEPVNDGGSYLRLRNLEDQLRREQPLVEDSSVDCVLSNCVINLVRNQDRRALFAEIYRVLKPGGRAAISDIVSDEDVPLELQRDPTLWSGCISGAFREDLFVEAFEDAGFQGIEIVRRESQPWQTVQGIEFRSMTIVAHKGEQGPCLERNQAVVYRGPFKVVIDEQGNKYERGQRIAVCDRTFQELNRKPYRDMFLPIEPLEPVPAETAQPFDCSSSSIRSPQATKGSAYKVTLPVAGDCCGGGSCC